MGDICMLTNGDDGKFVNAHLSVITKSKPFNIIFACYLEIKKSSFPFQDSAEEDVGHFCSHAQNNTFLRYILRLDFF